MIGWIVLSVLSWGTFFGMCWVAVFCPVPAVLFILIEVLSLLLCLFATFSETTARLDIARGKRLGRNVRGQIIRPNVGEHKN